jgi:hypothetical protein
LYVLVQRYLQACSMRRACNVMIHTSIIGIRNDDVTSRYSLLSTVYRSRVDPCGV